MSETTMIIDQNNWILPLRGEVHVGPAVREQGLQIRAGWERTPTFEQLNQEFWPQRFDETRTDALRRLCQRLRLSADGERDELIARLTTHFQTLIRSTTTHSGRS